MGPTGLVLARTAARFGKSPALDYMRLEDPVIALQVDQALALRLAIADRQAAEKERAMARSKGTLAPGQRYETAADYVNPGLPADKRLVN